MRLQKNLLIGIYTNKGRIYAYGVGTACGKASTSAYPWVVSVVTETKFILTISIFKVYQVQRR